ncbi:hypothetical protein Q5752_000721 [Cryptotrichosporon argae]
MSAEGTDAKYVEDEKAVGLDVDVVPADELVEAQEMIRAEHEFTEDEYKRLMRKVDFALMPLLMITYGLQYSDKGSLSSGVVFGLKTDTHLVGNQYANLSSFFYMAYALSQIPMMMLIQRLPLGRSLSVCVIIWGALVMALAGCNNYAELSVVRVLLGWFEAVVTPGFGLLVSSWYLRKEQSLRQCFYYAMNTFFAIIFGLGIYYIALRAETHGGMQAWRVINLFLGGTTVGVGILLFIFIGTPDEVWWLSKREKIMAHARIVSNATGGGESHPWKWEQVRECFHDPQYFFTIMYNLLSTIPNGALGTFSVLVYESFGFTNLQSILYGLPSNAIGFSVVICSSFIVRYFPRARYPIALVCQIIPIVVFLFVGLAPDDTNKWAKWGVFSFVAVFAVTTFMVWPLMSINVAGRTKKSWVNSTSLFAYCVGNIIGTQIFLTSDAPKYLHGLTACAIVMSVNVLNISAWWFYYSRENRKREAAFVASGMSVEEREYQSKLAGETDMTDRQNPHFRYAC